MRALKFISFALMSTVVMGAASSAVAAIAVPYGWYVEANAGRSQLQGKTYPSNNVDKSGVGGNVNAGYKFSPFFAGEIGYTYYAPAYIYNSFNTKVAKDRHYSYDIAGKVMLPIGSTGAEVFGKLGIARINSNLTVTNPGAAALNGLTFNSGTHAVTAPYFGGGADYAVLTNLFVNVQWMRANGNNSTGVLDLYSLGLSYIF